MRARTPHPDCPFCECRWDYAINGLGQVDTTAPFYQLVLLIDHASHEISRKRRKVRA